MPYQLRTEKILPDIIDGGIRILLVGSAVTPASAEFGHYFTGEEAILYQVLYETGLLPGKLAPSDDHRLPEFGIGITTLSRTRAVENPEELDPIDYDIGGLIRKVFQFTPRVVCFLGKTPYSQFADRPAEYGMQTDRIGDAVVLVAPSPADLKGNKDDKGLTKYFRILNDHTESRK